MTDQSEADRFAVALLTEGVDRNRWYGCALPAAMVALLTEGVDRNGKAGIINAPIKMSPSSRRAWIEIHVPAARRRSRFRSPSSRRAWIEIDIIRDAIVYYSVSPSSRRAWIEIF